MAEEKKKQRIVYFDIAKGILILMLVYAHFRSAKGHLNNIDSPYFEISHGWISIYTCFFMPAFFIISGYCSNFDKELKSFLVSLFKSLIIPLFSLMLIDEALSYALNNSNFLASISKRFFEGGGLWFLNALIIAKLVNYLLRDKCKYVSGGVLLLLMITGVTLFQYRIGSNILYYQNGLIASFWVGVGCWFREHKDYFEKMMNISFFIFPFIAIAAYLKPLVFDAGIGLQIPYIPVHIIYALFGTFFLINLSKRIDSNKELQYWGQNTLVVYALHFTPLLFVMNYLWHIMEPNDIIVFVLYLLLLCIIEYIICRLVMWLFQYKPLKYLLGKF